MEFIVLCRLRVISTTRTATLLGQISSFGIKLHYDLCKAQLRCHIRNQNQFFERPTKTRDMWAPGIYIYIYVYARVLARVDVYMLVFCFLCSVCVCVLRVV